MIESQPFQQLVSFRQPGVTLTPVTETGSGLDLVLTPEQTPACLVIRSPQTDSNGLPIDNPQLTHCGAGDVYSAPLPHPTGTVLDYRCGNLDWVGDDGEVLSWWGPPSRYHGAGGWLKNKVYRRGQEITCPGPVCGAAIYRDHIVVVVAPNAVNENENTGHTRAVYAAAIPRDRTLKSVGSFTLIASHFRDASYTWRKATGGEVGFFPDVDVDHRLWSYITHAFSGDGSRCRTLLIAAGRTAVPQFVEAGFDLGYNPATYQIEATWVEAAMNYPGLVETWTATTIPGTSNVFQINGPTDVGLPGTQEQFANSLTYPINPMTDIEPLIEAYYGLVIWYRISTYYPIPRVVVIEYYLCEPADLPFYQGSSWADFYENYNRLYMPVTGHLVEEGSGSTTISTVTLAGSAPVAIDFIGNTPVVQAAYGEGSWLNTDPASSDTRRFLLKQDTASTSTLLASFGTRARLAAVDPRYAIVMGLSHSNSDLVLVRGAASHAVDLGIPDPPAGNTISVNDVPSMQLLAGYEQGARSNDSYPRYLTVIPFAGPVSKSGVSLSLVNSTGGRTAGPDTLSFYAAVGNLAIFAPRLKLDGTIYQTVMAKTASGLHNITTVTHRNSAGDRINDSTSGTHYVATVA